MEGSLKIYLLICLSCLYLITDGPIIPAGPVFMCPGLSIFELHDSLSYGQLIDMQDLSSWRKTVTDENDRHIQ